MPTSLTFAAHLDALESNGTRLADLAVAAGMDAPVPPCPDWTTNDLVAHAAMVHRFAAANVRCDDPPTFPDQTEIRKTVEDLVGYYRDGHAALLDALRHAPPDLAAPTFLNDAPAPKEFWARRQAHETTIHMVDALAASLGRMPTAAETEIDPALAVDGIDELVCGFLTRGRSKLFDGVPYTITIAPADAERHWTLKVDESLTVEPEDQVSIVDGADSTITGTAVQLYLTLWNRSIEASASGQQQVLQKWRAVHRVTWN